MVEGCGWLWGVGVEHTCVVGGVLCLSVCLSLTSLCHSNGHIKTMPAREINFFTVLTRIRSQFLRTQCSTSIDRSAIGAGWRGTMGGHRGVTS